MSKALIIADIHIDDYANYNYDYRSRLNQFETLADRLIEIGKLEDCSELWILGDLIDKPNSRPYILHRANRFITKLCNHFTVVRYILGNHDLDSKSQDLTADDSLVTVLDHDNLVYMNRQLMEVNGHLYGFMDWKPEQDLDWLGDKHLDVLFGHYTKSELFGQEIDESKFDLMIHGDIHNSQVIGKFVSVCNPIQKDMSSEREGKVLIFDMETMDWKRVLTDPDHTRFLQISYVTDQSLEGFRGPLQYNIFRPELTSEQVSDTEKTLTWNDIDELIDSSCKTSGLEDIHSEVVANCDEFVEMDFNFQITYLKIHGYRSIEDMELTFDTGDRIALLGSNGSGKSSIIRALQGAFLKNSDLKYEQSTFTEDVQIILRLVYQNKVYEIRKGSQWGLFIDGEEQSYHGIRDFESDIPNKLPFLNYLDLFFLNSNISNLSSQFNPTRRIELISKFYRLDRINSYYSTALRLYNQVNKELIQLQSDRNVQCGISDHIVARLTELQSYEGKSITEYKLKLDEYKSLRLDYDKYLKWTHDRNALTRQLDECINTIRQLDNKLSFDYDQGVLDLEDLKAKRDQINEAYEKTYKNSIDFESQLKELLDVESKGIALRDKLNTLLSGRCPECNAPLESGKSRELKLTYETELERLGTRWDELDRLMSTHEKGRDSKEWYFKVLTGLKEGHKEVINAIELLENKISNYNTAKGTRDHELSRKSDLQSRIDQLLLSKPTETHLPFNIGELEAECTTNITKIEEYQRQLEDQVNINLVIESLDRSISETNIRLDRLNKYLELTSMTGVIFEEILKKLAIKFSTTEVKYEVESGWYRGSRFINFNSYYLSKGVYRIYESCSDGQKTVCDLDFLEKLFSVNIGLLTLDEYLKHLDDSNFSKVCDILTRINVNTVILSTHDGNLTAYTRRILLSLDNQGKTISSIV